MGVITMTVIVVVIIVVIVSNAIMIITAITIIVMIAIVITLILLILHNFHTILLPFDPNYLSHAHPHPFLPNLSYPGSPAERSI